MSTTYYATRPPAASTPERQRTRQRRLPRRLVVGGGFAGSLALLTGIAAAVSPGLAASGAVTLAVFLVAVWLWTCSSLDDTYVALGAAVAVVLLGPVDVDTFTGTLGQSIIWLLVGAFVLAAAVTASGLAARAAAVLVSYARTPRQLVHLITLALIATAFVIPATSGRAALAVPVFVSLAVVLRERKRVVLCLALVFPTVILLSAVGSLLGAGAHLVTSEIVRTATGSGFSFIGWALLGLPLAILWSHLAAELVLLMFTSREDRRARLNIEATDVAREAKSPLTVPQRRVLLVLGAVVALWCTEPVHGVDPAVVALIGALVATAPAIRATSLPSALKTIPWSLLIFLAATLCLGVALTASGASEWAANQVFAPVQSLGVHAGFAFVVVVVVLSVAAHLLIQSRSARSAVLIPIVIATAPIVGVDPAEIGRAHV